MMASGLNIVFMGTPAYAVPCLEALAGEGHAVSLVVTQPDRPQGRGRRLAASPVKKTAQRLGYPVSQPESVKSETFARQIHQAAPEVIVVVAFGGILPFHILDLPYLGPVNIHPSLLPAYRGPSPIQWAIANMETITGVTSIYMNEQMDAGDIILSRPEPIYPDDTAADLHDRLAVLGAEVLLETLQQIRAGTAQAVPQDHSRATFAPLLKKTDGHIVWNQPAGRLEAFIRAMTPWPGAFAFLNEKRYKIFRAQVVETEVKVPPGTVLKGFPGELWVAAARDALSIQSIQGESGKVQDIETFLRGAPISPGSVFA